MKHPVTIGVIMLARNTFDFEAARGLYADIKKNLAAIPDATFVCADDLVFEVPDLDEPIDKINKANVDGTASNQLFSTYIEEWQGNIVDTYGKIDKALRQVAGSTIEDREVLREGVVRVTYANGVEIYVNYLGTDYTDGDIKVPAQDYLVRG